MRLKTGLALVSMMAFYGCGGDDHGHSADAGEDHNHMTPETGPGPDASVPDAPVPDVSPDQPAGGTPVEIRFEAVVGSMPFTCFVPDTGAFSNVGAANSPWTPLDFRFYVHDVQLLPESGPPVTVNLDQDGTWQYRNVALLDFENAGGSCTNGTMLTNTSVRGRVNAPAGTRWAGLRFKLGVPHALNHQNPATAPSPLNLSTLFWAWQSGYKFARIDGRSGTNAFNIHLGSTGCTGDPMAGTVTCSEPNRPEYTFMGFDPARNVVVADLARLVATTDVSRDMGGAPGCMSGLMDPECRTILPAFGISMGGAPAMQTFFRVR